MDPAPTRTIGVSRRDVVSSIGALGVACAVPSRETFANDSRGSPSTLLKRKVPSTGEELVSIGLGTKAALFSVKDPREVADRHAILAKLLDLGGSVVDTADLYERSQDVIGEFVSGLREREKIFLATKIYAENGKVDLAKRQLEDAFKRLRTDYLDLLQVHSLVGADALMPVLEQSKKEGRVRYIGVTTDTDWQHQDVVQLIQKYRLDFVQINYSIDLRNAARKVFPAAQDRGTAVLANLALRGRSGYGLFSKVENLSVPAWAAEFGATTWAQFFLKYVLSNPAVTCAIPGTSKVSHLLDNFQAAKGPLPDVAARRHMEEFWESLW